MSQNGRQYRSHPVFYFVYRLLKVLCPVRWIRHKWEIPPFPHGESPLKLHHHLVQLLVIWKQIANGVHGLSVAFVYSIRSCWQGAMNKFGICVRWRSELFLRSQRHNELSVTLRASQWVPYQHWELCEECITDIFLVERDDACTDVGTQCEYTGGSSKRIMKFSFAFENQT